MTKTIFSAPKVTLTAKEFLKDKPDLTEYHKAAKEAVHMVVEGIMERIEASVSQGKSSKEIR